MIMNLKMACQTVLKCILLTFFYSEAKTEKILRKLRQTKIDRHIHISGSEMSLRVNLTHYQGSI